MRSLPTADFRRNVVARTPPAAQANSAPSNGRAPQRPGTTFDNVHLLNAQAGAARPAPANLPNMHRVEAMPPRADTLPSARYVRPETTMRTLPTVEPIRRASPADMQPRPGVSFISGPEPSRPQPSDYSARPADTLPQSPQFQRVPQYAQPRNQPVQGQSLRPSYYQPQQRQSFNPSYEPMQRGNSQPSWQPQQRFQQAPHSATPSQAQPQRHAESSNRAPPPSKYEQQH